MRCYPPNSQHANAAGPLAAAADIALRSRESSGLLRRRVAWRPTGPVTVERDGREYVNFASNNYLGLTYHPRLLAALSTAANVGSGAAGLISGHTDAHAKAEAAIADWKHYESAILLPSGYQANLAVVQTLAAIYEQRTPSTPDGYQTAPTPAPVGPGQAGLTRPHRGRRGADDAVKRPSRAALTTHVAGVRFLIDKLAHASLLDAVRTAGHDFRVFPHNGLAKLERLLADAPREQTQIVLTESIFSMDGDAADVRGLAELKQRHPFVFVMDEAHGSGIYGRHGAGLADELGLRPAVDVTVVTLSKALGLAGAAVCGPAAFVRAMENFGRAYIYSTAVAPLTAELAAEAVAICRDEPQHQRRVRMLASRVRNTLRERGLNVTAGDSPIIPILLGDPSAALAAANRLRDQSLLVVAVRPPTVPPGTSRLRITVSAAHSDEQIGRLLDALGQWLT